LPDELPNKLNEMASALNTIDNSDMELKKLKKDLTVAKQEFDAFATNLSKMRADAAAAMRDGIMAELPDLKLGSADFMVDIRRATPSASGVDDVLFMIKTNPGSPFAPLNKSASGGELARFMLALKVNLAQSSEVESMVFGEIDTGIGGATAQAVGEKLADLGKKVQVLVVTHSPQVAAQSTTHYKVEKHTENNVTITNVYELTATQKREEIARMLSGAQISDEARAAAEVLIGA
jgi:DNA repair protein RecN (Recombination protein N)